METEPAPPTPVEAQIVQAWPVADLARMTPEQQDAAVETLERAAELSLRLIKTSCLATFPHDWQEHGGSSDTEPSLYLEGEGALRMARPLGLKVGEPLPTAEKIDGCYFVESLVEVVWPSMGTRIVEMGSCNSYDKFFYKGENSEYARCLALANRNEKVAHRMMLPAIKKKANMNAISRAVTAITCTRGIKKSDLRDYGFPVDLIGKIKHKTGAKRTSQTNAATGKKETTESLKLVTVYQLTELPIGSVCSVTAEVLTVKHNTDKKGNPYTTFSVQDRGGAVTVWINVWGDLNSEPWAVVGALVHFPKVEVADYQGRNSYSSQHAEASA